MKKNQNPELEPTILVIFGITGDLSRRYLLPSLYYLIKSGLLHEKTRIIGVTRGDTTINEVFDKVKLDEIDADRSSLQKVISHLSMFRMDLDDQEAYLVLKKKLDE